MEYDYSKICGRIIEKCGTRSAFAEKIGLSEHTVSLKLNNKSIWGQAEIEKALKILDLDKTDIPAYFFALKVQN